MSKRLDLTIKELKKQMAQIDVSTDVGKMTYYKLSVDLHALEHVKKVIKK